MKPAKTARREKLRKVLVGCGVLSSVLYIGADVYAWTQYPGYSPVSQAFSELLAEGAPTRLVMLAVVGIPYNLLVAALGVGVWLSAAEQRVPRITAVLLVLYSAISFVGGTFFQMDQREVGGSARTLMHEWVTAMMVLTLLLTVGFGAFTRGTQFRAYSLASLLTILIFAGLAFQQAAQLQALETAPWLGLIERVNIYAWMLWVAVLAVSFWPVQRTQRR